MFYQQNAVASQFYKQCFTFHSIKDDFKPIVTIFQKLVNMWQTV